MKPDTPLAARVYNVAGVRLREIRPGGAIAEILSPVIATSAYTTGYRSIHYAPAPNQHITIHARKLVVIETDSFTCRVTEFSLLPFRPTRAAAT
jgi:hypothetical protein